MKKYTILLITILSYTLTYSQSNNNKEFLHQNKADFNVLTGTIGLSSPTKPTTSNLNNLNPSNFSCDCESDFFTVDINGDIQQWSIVNNTIVGGSVILTGGHNNGLAYCGPDGDRTFYCANYGNYTLNRYDTPSSSWISTTTPFQGINHGGFRNHQFFRSSSKSVAYYDGTNFSTVAQLDSHVITVADIAVDTLGQAWVFTGAVNPNSTQLRVYNSTGLVTVYSFNFDANGAYGAFFIGNQLYLGQLHENRIVPVIIYANTVFLGTPIPFPYIQYTDMASCHCIPPPPCPDLTPTTFILPGNISGLSSVQTAIRIRELNNADTDGTPITVRIPSDPRFQFTWNPGLTSAALIPVQNSDWNYLGDNTFYHAWTYNGPGQVLTGGTTTALGFQATYDPQSTSGTTTVTATVVPFSGGECTITNNVDSEKLVYFD